MASLDVIRTLTLRAKAEGFDTSARAALSMDKAMASLERRFVDGARQAQEFEKVQRQLNMITAQQPALQEAANRVLEAAAEKLGRTTSATSKMTAAMSENATASNKMVAGMSSVSQAADKMAASVANSIANVSSMTAAMSKFNLSSQTMVSGMSGSGQQAAQNALPKQLDAIAKGMTAAGSASRNMIQGMSAVGQATDTTSKLTDQSTNVNRLARYELINLSRQIQDVGVSLASGQNPLTVFIQQGSQIADVFQTSGVSARGFVSQIAGMVSPMMLLVGGITLVVGALTLMAKAWAQMAIQMDNLSKLTDMSTDSLQQLQQVAAGKGISLDEFDKGMRGFADQVSGAQRGLGELAQLLRQNGQAAGTVEQTFFKVADLVRNATTEVDKLNVLQAAGLPRTQEWVRLMEQGGDAVRKAAAAMEGAHINQEMVDKAREFTEAWDKAWAAFKVGAFSVIGDVLAGLGSLVTKAGEFLGEFTGLAPAGRRTRQDEINEEEAALAAKGGGISFKLGPPKPTITPEQLAAMERELSLMKQRIGLLGEMATSTEKAEVARKEIDLARMKGVEISKDEQDAIVKNIELDLKHGAKLKELKQDYGEIERAVSSFGNTFIQAMLNGADATEALGQSLKGLGSQLIQIGMKDFAKSISSGIGDLLSGVGGAIGGPLGTAAVGIGVSLIGQLFGKKDDPNKKRLEEEQARAAEELKRAQEAWAGMTDQLEKFNRTAKGLATGALTTSIESLIKDAANLMKAANAAHDFAGELQIGQTSMEGVQRLLNEFLKDLPDLISGFGQTGVIADATKSVDDLMNQYKQLSASIDELAKRTMAYNFAAEKQAELQEQARQALIAMLDVPKPLSEIGEQFATLNAKAKAVEDSLVELGTSAEDAATIVQEKLVKALDAMRGDFLSNLTKSINELSGGDWINQAADLAQKVAQMRADAATLGVQTTMIDQFFVLSAQKIVDSAELSGEAFQKLEQSLGLTGGELHAFQAEVEKTAEVVKRSVEEIAKAIQSNEDRLFNAVHRTDSIQDQLARFDLAAQREREQEVAAGGQALASLEKAQLQERKNLIDDYNAEQLRVLQDAQKKAADAAEKARQDQLAADKKAAEQRQRILEEATKFLQGALRKIQDWITNFLSGPTSTLSPSQQLATAQQAFATQLAAAQGGDRDALSGITSNMQDLVDAARRFYGSSAAGQTIINQALGQLQALPTQVSAEQFIVDAIEAQTVDINQVAEDNLADLKNTLATGNLSAFASALNAHFSELDSNLDGLLDFSEFTQGLHGMASDAQLAQMFKTLDTDNSGSISRLELINASTQQTNSNTNDISNDTNNLSPINTNTDETAAYTLSALNSLSQAVNNLSFVVSNTTTANALLQNSNAQLATQTNTMTGVAQSTALLTNINSLIAGIHGFIQISNGYLSSITSFTGSISSWSAGSNHAMGGLLTGPRHSAGGIMIAPGHYAEGGEYIMSRKSVANIGVHTLDSMNFGGVGNDNYGAGTIAAIKSLERSLLRGIQAMIEVELEAAGIISKPIEEANKVQRTRRGEKKVA